MPPFKGVNQPIYKSPSTPNKWWKKKQKQAPANTTTKSISHKELAQLRAESAHIREQLNPDRLTTIISQAIQNFKLQNISTTICQLGIGWKPYYGKRRPSKLTGGKIEPQIPIRPVDTVWTREMTWITVLDWTGRGQKKWSSRETQIILPISSLK